MRLFGRKKKTAAQPKKAEPAPKGKEEAPKSTEPATKGGKEKKQGFGLFHRKKEKHKPAESSLKRQDEVKQKTDSAESASKKAQQKPEAGNADKAKKKKSLLPFRVKIVPRFYENWVRSQIFFSGSERDPSRLIWNMAIISLIIGAAAGFIFRSLMVYVAPAAFFMTFLVFNGMLVLSVDRRGRFVDEILPDALLLLSANIRAGYIPSRALILSARKEFGPLSLAIRRAGKEIMTGASLEEGMKEIPRRIRSQDLSRTIKLIIEGIRGGGQIVTLLEENAIDIRRRQAIRKEIKANIMMYAIFIAFAGCLGAPGLYALSGYLTSTTSRLSPDVAMNSEITSKVGLIQMGGVSISDEFLFQFSIAAILITTVFGGLILGLINSGREKDGLKYAPILSIIALLVFFAATFLVNTMFSSIMPA